MENFMIIHIVESGETIDSIANTYQVSSARLIQENGLSNYDNLVVGQTIVIVRADKTYTVQEGDTLVGIAENNGISLIELLRNNPHLSERQYIFVGDVLVISYSEEKRGKMSTNGYAFPFINRDTLRKTLPFLTYLTIYEYRVTCEGELNNLDDKEIIQIAKAYGVAPLMLITTLINVGVDGNEMDFSILRNQEVQERFINNVLKVLEEKGYYGLNIFIQYFNLEHQVKVEEFIKNLTERLNKEGYQVLITLTPNTIIDESYKSIDYSILGQAANGVLLLSYEWGYSYGPPAAATSVPMVREYLDFGITQIPPEKIHIGIPVIAYNWELPYIPGVSSGNALSINSAIRLASETNATIRFDEIAQAPYFFYDIGSPDMKTTYIVWFKDARSIDVLTSLVPEYGLAGIAIWTIMNFFAQLWLIINTQYEIEKKVL
jgi:spore germination protein